jgi:hypothetical protein
MLIPELDVISVEEETELLKTKMICFLAILPQEKRLTNLIK